ncbi:MAG: metal-dependent hydrolase [Candidatus Izimaplasma sp.]|nr:metal-dependent hydrolase [Candidatus Izimaplasma bacterium]
MKLTYLGHAAVLIEDGSFKALIDPFLSGNPSYKKSKNHTLDITHIFLTHAHNDHIGDTIEIAKKNNAKIITVFELGNILKMKDTSLDVHTMHIGGRFDFDFGSVKMTPALHGSGFVENGKIYDGGNPCGFVIKRHGKTIYHAGDTGLTMDMKLLEEETIDVAFLPMGGNFTMDIEDAVRATTFIKPKTVIPIHFNTFGPIKANPKDFKKRVKKADVQILTPNSSYSI